MFVISLRAHTKICSAVLIFGLLLCFNMHDDLHIAAPDEFHYFLLIALWITLCLDICDISRKQEYIGPSQEKDLSTPKPSTALDLSAFSNVCSPIELSVAQNPLNKNNACVKEMYKCST
ncbi:serum paraoxonase/arylesterase 2 [Platysternon megacephalum]|uniref:Serum paraoxonase/arylesterase 2 n=1 Tax=Platysternon megacephalum TaxID=55544 RepID=A0A4D9EIF0_9SAUR|nr:serum paraoxonase/arylesterase 2 [Platysternon megacephalum]